MKKFRAKRSISSNKEAIKRVSKYGIAKVLEINEKEIIEEHVNFELNYVNPKNLGKLLRKIHSEKNKHGENLVHGDFGEHNTTIFYGKPKCFDYEHAHFGNTYADIGRVILRDCNTFDEIGNFFKNYSGKIPDPKEMKKGLSYFCEWQHDLRDEKGVAYKHIPLIRKDRLDKTNTNDFKKIIKNFKAEIK